LNYLPPWNDPETVVIACWSCNSSRGEKKISQWFKSAYCISRNININAVTDKVRNDVLKVENNTPQIWPPSCKA